MVFYQNHIILKVFYHFLTLWMEIIFLFLLEGEESGAGLLEAITEAQIGKGLWGCWLVR